MFIFFNSNIAIAACVASAMFAMVDMAYDASSINTLLLSEPFYTYFGLNATFIGLNVAIVFIGSMVAAPFAGPTIDKVGRKNGLVIGNILMIIGALIQAFARNEGMLLGGRLVLGFAFAINSTAGPSLVVESTPDHLVGVLTNLVTLGLPVAGLVIAFGMLAIYQSQSDWSWRGAFLGELAGPTISLLLLPFAPESPRWLADKNRNEDTYDVLLKMHSEDIPNRAEVVQKQYNHIVETLNFEKMVDNSGATSWGSLVARPSDRRRFAIAVLTNIFFQISGSNTLPFFFSLILQSAGIVDTRENLLVNGGLAICGVVSVTVGLWSSEKIGPKRALLGSAVVETICLAMVGLLTGLGANETSGSQNRFMIGAIAVLFIFQIASCSTWMILNFTYPARVLRFSQRARGFAVASAAGFGFCIMTSYCIPMAIEILGWKYYIINAAWNVIICFVIWWFFVEIKGLSLEEIDAVFDGNVHFGNETGQGIEAIEGIPEKESPLPITDDKSKKDGDKIYEVDASPTAGDLP